MEGEHQGEAKAVGRGPARGTGAGRIGGLRGPPTECLLGEMLVELGKVRRRPGSTASREILEDRRRGRPTEERTAEALDGDSAHD